MVRSNLLQRALPSSPFFELPVIRHAAILELRLQSALQINLDWGVEVDESDSALLLYKVFETLKRSEPGWGNHMSLKFIMLGDIVGSIIEIAQQAA